MKKIFTIDTVIAALFGAVGYGAGYVIPTSYGVSIFLSIVICMIAGTVCDKLADKLIFSSSVQKSTGKKYAIFTCTILLFLTAYFLVAKIYAHSLFSDLGYQLFFVIGIQIIAFFISLGLRFLKKRKLIKKYGSGESGFVFDKQTEDVMKTLTGENRELSEYSGKDPVVKTTSGLYVGKKSRNGVCFLGIPYASAERWKKPIPVEVSEKIYEAYYFGNTEIQPDNRHNILTHCKQSENCLNLNIWTAKLEPEANKPVLVYIHGGDGRYGSSTHPIYHLENIAKKIPDAVFVSINYRFGLFGVIDFASAGCPDADEYSDSTALSLLDQIEALKWIKKNISSFGGNPENITVAGDSNGGNCICMLAAVKEAKGLFNRALILGASSQDSPADNEKASVLGKRLLEEFKAQSISDLKAVTSEQLRDFSNRNYNLLEAPPRDGRIVPQDIKKAYLNGAASGIEFIFGFAADDITAWTAMLAGEVQLDAIMDEYFELLKKTIGSDRENKVDALLQKYIQSGQNVSEAKKSLLADVQYKASVLNDCLTLTEAGNKVRCFFWDVKGNIEKLRANSVSMITTFLGNLEIAEQMGYLNKRSITEIMQIFVNKYIHGQPMELFNNELKGVSEIVWDKFDAAKKNVLHIQDNSICMKERAFSENVCKLEKLVFERNLQN